MGLSSRFKVAYVPWWRPVRLAVKTAEGYDFVGWVWRQKANLVNNLHHGWIAFLDQQTPENLNRCQHCGHAAHQATKESSK